jgi:tetratricopeptide (TPR) repeat protein
MTRVARYRTSYFVLLAALAGGTYFVIRATGNSRVAFAAAAVLLLIPGRLQGLFFRPLFRGQRDLTQGKASDAAREFENFLKLLERQPWRQWALWLGWSLYTPSAKAMGFNNLGVAQADLGNEASARHAWESALAIDPLYPAPYANLAALAAAGGNTGQATSLLSQAKQLGYTGGALDQATHRVQQLLATVESRGPSV